MAVSLFIWRSPSSEAFDYACWPLILKGRVEKEERRVPHFRRLYQREPVNAEEARYRASAVGGVSRYLKAALRDVNSDEYPCAYAQPFEFKIAVDGYADVERSKALSCAVDGESGSEVAESERESKPEKRYAFDYQKKEWFITDEPPRGYGAPEIKPDDWG